jgi:hypothetical protein
MSRYWLVPLWNRAPLELGAGRICCEDSYELTDFRDHLSKLHPWMLPMFKASLLLSDESEQACGTGESDIRLDDEGSIIFDDTVYSLSHCAEAFVDRLPNPEEASKWLKKADTMNWSPSHRAWLDIMLEWNRQGFDIMLIKEENGI